MVRKLSLLVALLFAFAAFAQQPPADVLVVATSNDPQSVDPAWEMDNHAWMVSYYTYDRLMRYDGASTEVVPNLATSYVVSEDETEWTFTLRDDVRFADGSPLDADAVKYSFDRLLGVGAGPSDVFPTLENVVVVDPTTVRFELSEPFAPFLSTLADPGGAIVNPNVVKAHATDADPWARDFLARETAGSGAYVLSTWREGERIELTANPNYWGDAPALNRVLIRIVPEPSTQRILLERGEVDIAENLTNDQKNAVRDTAGVRIEVHPSLSVQYVYLNNRTLTDPVLRQALSYAVNYQGVIASIEQGQGEQLRGPVPVGLVGYNPDAFQFSYDPDKARELLAQAGYDGRELRLMFADQTTTWPALAQYLQSNLEAVGVRVKLEQYSWATMRERLDLGEFDLALGGWSPDFADPFMFMNYWFDSNNGGLAGNRAFYQNATVDDLVRRAAVLSDQDERLALYLQAMDIVVDEAPYVYLYQKTQQIAMRDRVQGYVFNPMMVDMYNFPTMSK